jgi:FkbM family methyltransferase
MKFLFYFHRAIDCLQDSAHTMDDMSGFSGTHACMFEVMRCLVQKGHEVFQVGMVREHRTIDGATYIPTADQLETFVNLAELDVFVQMFWFHELVFKLNPLRTRICIIVHCFIEVADIKNVYAPFSVDLVCISDYVLRKYASCDFFRRIALIPNGIPDSFIDTCGQKNPGKWIFHALYDRGGDVAYRIFDAVHQVHPAIASEMHVCSYYSSSISSMTMDDPRFVHHGSLDKKQLRDLLDACDYFVYPLVNPNCNVHHDTFGCVIAEALARGVIVVSWDIACNPGLYGDLILQVPHLPYASYDADAMYGFNPALMSPEAVELFRDAILDLERHPERKECMRQRGIQWARSNTWSLRAQEYSRFLTFSQYLYDFSRDIAIPDDHKRYLEDLKNNGFEPEVIYDIGSCVLHWTREARRLWPNAQIILFDAFAPAEFLYGDYPYFMGVLGDQDGKVVRFYQNDKLPGGNSYYRETYMDGQYFPADKYIDKVMHRLDTVVSQMKFPAPDLIKIDIQGCEMDVLKGGLKTVSYAKRLIVEMQHTHYNEGAPLVTETLPFIESLGFKCVAHRFSGGIHDADYGFERIS